MIHTPDNLGSPAFVAQRIEHLTTDQKVGGSSPSKRTSSVETKELEMFVMLDTLARNQSCQVGGGYALII